MGAGAKRHHKTFRRLAELARTRELDSELEQLGAQFDEWRSGKITGDDLDHAIHEYHKGPARDLYSMYTRTSPEILVAQAVIQDILSRDDIPDDLWEHVEQLAGSLRSAGGFL